MCPTCGGSVEQTTVGYLDGRESPRRCAACGWNEAAEQRAMEAMRARGPLSDEERARAMDDYAKHRETKR